MQTPPPSPYASAADAGATPPAQARLLAWVERIAAEVQGLLGAEQAAQARETFLRSTGRVHDGDPAFEERMSLFVEWYLLDRVSPVPPRVTPIEAWFAVHGGGLSPEARDIVRALATSHPSVFRWVGSSADGGLWVDDLLFGFRWCVADPAPPGLGVGDVFHARLAGLAGRVHFTGSFCYHPPEVAQRIARHLEAVAAAGAEQAAGVRDRLLRLRLAYDRSPETPAATIYRLEARISP